MRAREHGQRSRSAGEKAEDRRITERQCHRGNPPRRRWHVAHRLHGLSNDHRARRQQNRSDRACGWSVALDADEERGQDQQRGQRRHDVEDRRTIARRALQQCHQRRETRRVDRHHEPLIRGQRVSSWGERGFISGKGLGNCRQLLRHRSGRDEIGLTHVAVRVCIRRRVGAAPEADREEEGHPCQRCRKPCVESETSPSTGDGGCRGRRSPLDGRNLIGRQCDSAFAESQSLVNGRSTTLMATVQQWRGYRSRAKATPRRMLDCSEGERSRRQLTPIRPRRKSMISPAQLMAWRLSRAPCEASFKA